MSGALLLAAGGAAAATVTFTQLGTWLRGGAAPLPAAPALQEHAAAIEVEIPPLGLTVELAEAGDSLRLRVSSSGGALLEIAPSGAIGPLSFRSEPTRLVVSGADSGVLEVRVPAGAGPVRVVVGGLTVVVVRDGLARTGGDPPRGVLDALLGELRNRARGGIE